MTTHVMNKTQCMQYFYNSYRQETEALLKDFDAEFSEPLDKEGKKLKQVNWYWLLQYQDKEGPIITRGISTYASSFASIED